MAPKIQSKPTVRFTVESIQVRMLDGRGLGEIRWMQDSERYCFEPHGGGVVFFAEDLCSIAKELDQLTAERLIQ
jgi:hypothetical protein